MGFGWACRYDAFLVGMASNLVRELHDFRAAALQALRPAGGG